MAPEYPHPATPQRHVSHTTSRFARRTPRPARTGPAPRRVVLPADTPPDAPRTTTGPPRLNLDPEYLAGLPPRPADTPSYYRVPTAPAAMRRALEAQIALDVERAQQVPPTPRRRVVPNILSDDEDDETYPLSTPFYRPFARPAQINIPLVLYPVPIQPMYPAMAESEFIPGVIMEPSYYTTGTPARYSGVASIPEPIPMNIARPSPFMAQAPPPWSATANPSPFPSAASPPYMPAMPAMPPPPPPSISATPPQFYAAPPHHFNTAIHRPEYSPVITARPPPIMDTPSRPARVAPRSVPLATGITIERPEYTPRSFLTTSPITIERPEYTPRPRPFPNAAAMTIERPEYAPRSVSNATAVTIERPGYTPVTMAAASRFAAPEFPTARATSYPITTTSAPAPASAPVPTPIARPNPSPAASCTPPLTNSHVNLHHPVQTTMHPPTPPAEPTTTINHPPLSRNPLYADLMADSIPEETWSSHRRHPMVPPSHAWVEADTFSRTWYNAVLNSYAVNSEEGAELGGTPEEQEEERRLVEEEGQVSGVGVELEVARYRFEAELVRRARDMVLRRAGIMPRDGFGGE